MYLGLDIGTSSIKGLLQNQNGKTIASHNATLSVSRPKEGYSEQNPQDWIEATKIVISAIKNRVGSEFSQLLAIGLSGQMHGLVAMDEADIVLRPAILWNDSRCDEQAKKLDVQFPDFRKIAGNAVMAGFTAPKAVWMAEQEKEIFKQIKTILLPKDYVRFWLTGEKFSDMSDASGTLWLDVEKREYSETLISHCGLDISQMPSLKEGSDPAGVVRKSLANKWGISSKVVVGGAGDNAAAACGLGVVVPGDAFVSLGTSGVVFKVTEKFYPEVASGAHAFCHALPKLWHQMGVTLSATDSLNWLSEITGTSVVSLANSAANVNVENSTLLFHPYLSGERTPHNDSKARGGFFGLSRSHGRADMAYSVFEGITYALADCLDVISKSDQKPKTLLAVGGGAKNFHWLQQIADCTGVTVSLPKEGEFGGANGAARLAALATGRDPEDILSKPEILRIFNPVETTNEIHKSRRLKWQSIYHSLSRGAVDVNA